MDSVIGAFFQFFFAFGFAFLEIIEVRFITEITQDKIGDYEEPGQPNYQFDK
jgi:hypothetical protein